MTVCLCVCVPLVFWLGDTFPPPPTSLLWVEGDGEQEGRPWHYSFSSYSNKFGCRKRWPANRQAEICKVTQQDMPGYAINIYIYICIFYLCVCVTHKSAPNCVTWPVENRESRAENRELCQPRFLCIVLVTSMCVQCVSTLKNVYYLFHKVELKGIQFY